MEINFKGRAIVTGGTRGIGRIIVENLIKEGYFVDFTYLNSKDDSDALEEEFKGYCRGTKVNGSNRDEVKKYIEEISEDDNHIKVLVNNAGITKNALIKDGTWEEYKDTIDTNLGGTFNFCKEIMPQMIKARGGDVINISSLATGNIRMGNGFYGASKCAIERFSKSLALESARLNIAVNVVAPGFVETDIIKDIIQDQKARVELLKQIPLRRFTKPQEVAEAVLFLIRRTPLLIGAVIPVGGGGQLL